MLLSQPVFYEYSFFFGQAFIVLGVNHCLGFVCLPVFAWFSKWALFIFFKWFNISATHLWIIFSIYPNTSVPFSFFPKDLPPRAFHPLYSIPDLHFSACYSTVILGLFLCKSPVLECAFLNSMFGFFLLFSNQLFIGVHPPEFSPGKAIWEYFESLQAWQCPFSRK